MKRIRFLRWFARLIMWIMHQVDARMRDCALDLQKAGLWDGDYDRLRASLTNVMIGARTA